MADEKKKSCFVIMPIGEDDSSERRRSDAILKYIIAPAVAECGYGFPVRADEIGEPGMITSQVIDRLVGDDLVVADLSGRNANVFYELAIRHAVRKPVLVLVDDPKTIPFDVKDTRAIVVDHTDLSLVEAAKRKISEQTRYIDDRPEEAHSPVTVAIDVRSAQHAAGGRVGQVLSQVLRWQERQAVELQKLSRSVERLRRWMSARE